MEKIKMVTPLVEMDGDEMTRILWQMIKDQLILPFVDLKTEYYDLGLLHRNETQDQVTVDAANATRRLGVAVKCATITPNKQRMEEYPQLTQMWKSPNGTIRSILDGTVFRAPILIDSIHPVVKNWKKPITIARHAYGDVYKSVDLYTTEPGECTMTFKGQSGEEKTLLVQKVDGPAVWQGAHNKEKSIRSFARACFQYAIDTKQDLWFSTKDTIAKVYDGEFKKVFEEEFESYKAKFDELGITYFYTLIDDAVARVIRSQGGFIWACKNYDGDVMSDMVSTAFGGHHGHHFCLVRRVAQAGPAGRPDRPGRLCRQAGGRLLRDPGQRHHDQGPGGPGGRGHPRHRRQQQRIHRRDPRPSGREAVKKGGREMNLLITATAGTMESNDIMVTLEPAQSGGIQISLTSNVLQQFGRQIEAVIRDTLTHYGIENAEVTAVDKGALDCTVRARVTAAIFRSAQSDAYEWEVK